MIRWVAGLAGLVVGLHVLMAVGWVATMPAFGASDGRGVREVKRDKFAVLIACWLLQPACYESPTWVSVDAAPAPLLRLQAPAGQDMPQVARDGRAPGEPADASPVPGGDDAGPVVQPPPVLCPRPDERLPATPPCSATPAHASASAAELEECPQVDDGHGGRWRCVRTRWIGQMGEDITTPQRCWRGDPGAGWWAVSGACAECYVCGESAVAP